MGSSIPFFIVGCPRSGTSLVAQILHSHSRLGVYFESNYYTTFAPQQRYYGALRQSRNLRRLVADFLETLRIQGIEPPTVEDILAALPAPTFEAVLTAWLHIYGRQLGKKRTGDKTPGHVFYLNRILDDFPESPVFFVLRDPRDTIYSMRQRFSMSLMGATWSWNAAYQALVQVSRPVHVVRYEELVSQPVETARAMCQTLGESFEPGMLEFYNALPPQLQAFPARFLGKLAQPITGSSVGQFKKMPSKEVEYIERVCARGMRERGYAQTVDRGAAPLKLRERLPSHIVLRDRVRFYGVSPRRWKRGFLRWRLLLRIRLRYWAAGRSG